MQARNFAQVAQLYRHHIDGFELVVLGLVGLSKHLFFELELLPVWISLVEHSYLSAGLRSSVLLADQVGNRTTTVSDARVPRYQLHHESSSWLSWYRGVLDVADRLPVVVRFPAGPRVRLKTVDPPKGNGLGQKKRYQLHHEVDCLSRVLVAACRKRSPVS